MLFSSGGGGQSTELPLSQPPQPTPPSSATNTLRTSSCPGTPEMQQRREVSVKRLAAKVHDHSQDLSIKKIWILKISHYLNHILGVFPCTLYMSLSFSSPVCACRWHLLQRCWWCAALSMDEVSCRKSDSRLASVDLCLYVFMCDLWLLGFICLIFRAWNIDGLWQSAEIMNDRATIGLSETFNITDGVWLEEQLVKDSAVKNEFSIKCPQHLSTAARLRKWEDGKRWPSIFSVPF